MKPWRLAMVGLGLALASPLSWAAAAIQAITSTQQAGADVVRIELSEALPALPAGFVVQSPPRIAIDLPGVSSNLPRNVVNINNGNVRTVNVANAGDRSRLVLNLRQATTYRSELQGTTLLVFLDPPVASAPAAAPTNVVSRPSTATAATADASDAAAQFAENKNTAPLALKDIDFRRGRDGAGRVVVELPNNQVGVDIRQQGQSLVVEFVRTSLPERLRKRYDVADFGTPVRQVTATQTGDRVKLVVDPTGDWEHSAYQSDNQFVLEVRSRKVDPNKLTQGPGYSGEKLSLNFQNIEVRALLQVIADFTNFNVVTSDTVNGSVTLRLKDVPWDQALDIIMQAKGLGVRKSGNVLWIAPKDEINAKEKIDLEAKAQVAALEPLRNQSFQLNYTKAEEIARGLTGTRTGGGTTTGGASNSTRILSPRGSVIFEARTNQLFVNDIPSKLEEIQAMITKIDIAPRQVLIEARIVEADDSFSKTLGVRLGASNKTAVASAGNLNLGINGNYSGTVASPDQGIGGVSSINNSYFVNLPGQGINGFNPATLGVSLFTSSVNHALNLEISALEADGRGKVVSSPRVITANQQEATIEQGTELPYQTATSSGATAITFRKANLRLKVTPQITPEGSVILDVDVNKDSVGQVTTAGFAIDTKHVETQVLVENGGTVVIGGIFTQREASTEQRVPLLGDIPVLGNLFKNNTRSNNRTELLIFLTPKVVSDRAALR